MEENKPDVFGTKTKPNKPMPDFEAMYDVNNPLLSEEDKAQAKELADIAKKQYLEREAKLNPPKEDLTMVNPTNSNSVTTQQPSPTETVLVKEPRYSIEKDYDSPFDLVELPSKGKILPYRKDRLKVAYLNASDEDILTSHGILESGEFFDYLFDRKILDNLSYRDLHVGDRNAILIWLRATGYGNSYPVMMTDPETGEDFEHVFDLSELRIKYLELEPNANGYFDYTFPVCKKNIEFRFLSVNDIEELDESIKNDLLNDVKISKTVTKTLKKQIVSVDGNNDPKFIENFIKTLPIQDSRSFRKYYEENESGIDLSVTVETPGGASIASFLPLGFSFFWPEL